MPKIHFPRPPHRRFAAEGMEQPCIQRSVGVEGRRRLDPFCDAALPHRTCKGAVGSDLCRKHMWPTPCFDPPRITNVSSGGDSRKRIFRIVARQKPTVEGKMYLVLNG